MESIFESLENLNVSEECFDEIVNIVEKVMAADLSRAAKKSRDKRREEAGQVLDDGFERDNLGRNKGVLLNRMGDVDYLSKIPSPEKSGITAKKLIQAAKNSLVDRNLAYDDALASSPKTAKGNIKVKGKEAKEAREKRDKLFDRKMRARKIAELGLSKAKKNQLLQDTIEKEFERENNKVSESLYNEIADLVEAILDEGRQEGETLSQYKGRLQDKYIPKLRDEKATQSALRKHEEKKVKQALRKEKEIKNTELPKAEYNKQIASGNFANAAARYNYELERNGKHNPVTKRALEAVKHFRKKDIEAGNALDAVKDRMSDERIKAVYGDVNAGAYKRETGDIADKIRKLS